MDNLKRDQISKPTTGTPNITVFPPIGTQSNSNLKSDFHKIDQQPVKVESHVLPKREAREILDKHKDKVPYSRFQDDITQGENNKKDLPANIFKNSQEEVQGMMKKVSIDLTPTPKEDPNRLGSFTSGHQKPIESFLFSEKEQDKVKIAGTPAPPLLPSQLFNPSMSSIQNSKSNPYMNSEIRFTPSSGLNKGQSPIDSSGRAAQISFKDFLGSDLKGQQEQKDNPGLPKNIYSEATFKPVSSIDALSFQFVSPVVKKDNIFPVEIPISGDKGTKGSNSSLSKLPQRVESIKIDEFERKRSFSPLNQKEEYMVPTSEDRLLIEKLPKPVVMPSRAVKPIEAYKNIEKGKPLPGHSRVN